MIIRGSVYVRVFIWLSVRTCINIYVGTVFLKKRALQQLGKFSDDPVRRHRRG
jgi:hypothetical protein